MTGIDFEEKVSIGHRLKVERVRRRMLIVDLAKRSGVCKAQISRIEKGQIKVRVRDLLALCMALEVNPMMILCGSENWNPKEVVL